MHNNMILNKINSMGGGISNLHKNNRLCQEEDFIKVINRLLIMAFMPLGKMAGQHLYQELIIRVYPWLLYMMVIRL